VTQGYSEVAIDHFENPRNKGVIEQPDGVGVDMNPVCGDLLTLTLRVVEGRITDARQEVKGCNGAEAASSVLTELVIGRTVDEAEAFTHQQILDALGGLPASKLHSASLAALALRKAIAYYRKKQAE
jgi:nitrogen fixation NifU-like protein